MIKTQGDAKRFFVAKILAEAEHEGLTLSDAERQMLSWSESDPEFKADPSLIEQLSAEMSDEEYETRICRLLDAAYRRDCATDPDQRDVYRRAHSVLKEGDHYLLVMVDKVLEGHAALALRFRERIPTLMWIHIVVCVLAIPKALFSDSTVGTAVLYSTLLGWVVSLVVLYAFMFKGRQWARWVAALLTFPIGPALLLWGPVDRFVASRRG